MDDKVEKLLEKHVTEKRALEKAIVINVPNPDSENDSVAKESAYKPVYDNWKNACEAYEERIACFRNEDVKLDEAMTERLNSIENDATAYGEICERVEKKREEISTLLKERTNQYEEACKQLAKAGEKTAECKVTLEREWQKVQEERNSIWAIN